MPRKKNPDPLLLALEGEIAVAREEFDHCVAAVKRYDAIIQSLTAVRDRLYPHPSTRAQDEEKADT